jgi:sugar phosphate isomerase/epimerase
VREALTLAGHPHCGVLLDTYHLQRSGGSVQGLEDIVYFQFSDVPRQGLVPGKSLDRLPPGQGCVPFREIGAWLTRIGYRGYLSSGPRIRSLGAGSGGGREALQATPRWRGPPARSSGWLNSFSSGRSKAQVQAARAGR